MGPDEEHGGGGGCGATEVAASESKRDSLRIYVGGLGGNVSEDDLKKTFSSPQLGTVDSVEIVRTKGRSFAYLDFLPSSDKGLAKLFSTYNGCMWKGGRLRLEKAKEHYMVRLRREWAEDGELSSDSRNFDGDAVGSMHSSEKLVKDHNLENMQLKIFFPKLRKLKSVPLKGTGKHKYSFQRAEVPPLPIHFCDCEEHSGPAGAAKESQNQEDEMDGMNEEELNMMKSVMNQIFNRGKITETAHNKVGFAPEAFISTNLIDDFQVDENANQMSDEDNLIINMVDGSNTKITLTNPWGEKAITGHQDSLDSKTRQVLRTRGNHGKKIELLPNKKRKAPLDLETVPDGQTAEPGSGIQRSSYSNVSSQKSACRDLVTDRGDSSFRISDILQSDGPGVEMQAKLDSSVPNKENYTTRSFQVEEANRSAETVSDSPGVEVNKGGKGVSWVQKFSWKQLVGNNSSFSISQIVPGLSSEKQDLPLLKGIGSSTSMNNKQIITKTDRSDLNIDAKPQVKADVPISLADLNSNQDCLNELYSVKKLQPDKSGDEACIPPQSEKQPMPAKRTSIGGTGVVETFSFKRTTASMNEWKKAKAAISGSLKKKGKEK